MNAPKKKITPIILSGGSGTRLWPLSRPDMPKQFLNLISKQSGFEDAIARCTHGELFGSPQVICAHNHRPIVRDLLGETPATIIMEPQARDTAAAICIAALSTPKDALLLIMPSDHYIPNIDAFQSVVVSGADLAAKGHIVLFGVNPTRLETGYGYIKRGAEILNAYEISSFHEKPNLETAKSYIRSSNYFWNSGIFLAHSEALLKEFAVYAPDLLQTCQNAWDKRNADGQDLLLDYNAYNAIKAQSFDYEIMEKTQKSAVLPANFLWDDCGSWQSLLRINNALSGNGNTDFDVIETGKSTHPQSVKRPWGSYQVIEERANYKVKSLKMNSGYRLSLQTHAKRSEYWVVVKGIATVTKDGEVFDLNVNESTYIPCGMVHRLENRSREPIEIIELQTGSYLGEDDIIRLEHDYDEEYIKSRS